MNNDTFFQKPGSRDIRFESPTFIDHLTGLFNRYYLNQFLPEEIKKATLNNYPLAFLMVDLDGFKKINDTYGHLCGDKILTQVSDIIKKAVRQTDTVIRFAGDEFVILFPGAGLEKTPALCTRLLSDVQKNVFLGDKDQKIRLSLSIGFAIYPEDAQEQIKLIDMADKALYLSKKRGRNTHSSAKEVTVEEVSSLIAMDSFPCPEFINHQQELNKIRQIFDIVVKTNSLQAVFISGLSGVGKSRIIREIRTYLKDQIGLIYCISSSEHRQDPYYLFAKGIGAYIDLKGIENTQITDILLKVPLIELTELSLITPQLRNIVKKPMDLERDDKKRRFLLFKAFVDFLIELNKSFPVLLIFDDIQWADRASLELLRYLIKQEKNRRVFIVCVFSQDRLLDRSESYSLEGFLKEIAANDNVTEIKLDNLSLVDTSGMIEAIFQGVGKLKEFTDLIYEVTKGNPSFIEELLKSLVEKGIIFYQNDSWQIKQGLTNKDIPVSMEEIVKERLKNLDDETKELIVQAAVIGDNFGVDILKKIGDKDEGFVSEVINRAKRMRWIDEFGTEGGFNFINRDTKNILYGELNEEQRHSTHYKIAQVLANKHKDNLYDVAGEVSFHFSQAPQQEETKELNDALLKKTSELFEPQEVAGYLEQLAKDILARKEKVIVNLSDRMMKEAMKVIIFLQGAIKKFRLYPSASSVRVNTVKEIHPFLNKIFAEVENLIISEVERSLVINGKRLPPSEVEYTNVELFLFIMMDQNIKTISFKRGLRENELNTFIHYISQSRQDLINKGGWPGIINKEGLEHIGIDEVHFTSVDDYTTKSEDKKKLQDVMLMEFLMGKMDPARVNKEEIIANIEKNPKEFARTIMDITNVIAEKEKNTDKAGVIADVISKIDSQVLANDPKAGEHIRDLAKIILEFEPKLRNKVMRSLSSGLEKEPKKVMSDIAGNISDDIMIDMIIEEYKNNISNPLIAREFINGILVKEEQKKRILENLGHRLSEINSNDQEVAFIVGKIKWEDLPVDKRIDMILRLPEDYYSVSVFSKINNILVELDSIGKKEELKDTISWLLIKNEQIDVKLRDDLLGIIIDFTRESFVIKKEEHPGIPNRVSCILEKLEIETEASIFANILKVFKQVITDFIDTLPELRNITLEVERPLTKKYYLFIDQLLYLLLKRFKIEKDQHSKIYELIQSFVSDISSSAFLEILSYRIADNITKNKYDIQDMRLLFGDKIIDTLINLTIKKNLDLKDPFREFLFKKSIANLLIDLKDASSYIYEKISASIKKEVSVPLIELIGYLKKDDFIDLLLPFIHHKDSVIRVAIITALNWIGGEKSVEILTMITKEEQNSNIRDLANSRLDKLKKKIPP